MMGIILGYVCLILFCALAAKAITHRCHWKKADQFLMKYHKLISGLLCIFCVAHVILVIPVLQNRNTSVLVTGLAALLFMVLLIGLCHRVKEKKKKMWWHRALTMIMAICIVGHMITYVIDFRDYKQKIANIVLEDIDLASIADGVYVDEYDAGYIYAKVEVEIKDSKLVSVTLLEHQNERGKSAESILEDMVANQEIDVDTVSGATNSSNVIKKAVQNALRE